MTNLDWGAAHNAIEDIRTEFAGKVSLVNAQRMEIDRLRLVLEAIEMKCRYFENISLVGNTPSIKRGKTLRNILTLVRNTLKYDENSN